VVARWIEIAASLTLLAMTMLAGLPALSSRGLRGIGDPVAGWDAGSGSPRR